MHVSPTTSTNALHSADNLLSSGLDPSLLVYAMQIQQQDKFVLEQLAEIKQIGKLRDAINDQLTKLRELKGEIARSGSGQGDERYQVTGDDNDGKITTNELHDKLLHITKEFAPSSDGGVSVKDGPTLGGWVWHPGRGCNEWRISVVDVDKEINRLQGQAQALDSDRELKMIAMNQFLNKKEQSVSQLTNFLKKNHDTRSAVIANMK